jgi:hypothetical protein
MFTEWAFVVAKDSATMQPRILGVPQHDSAITSPAETGNAYARLKQNSFTFYNITCCSVLTQLRSLVLKAHVSSTSSQDIDWGLYFLVFDTLLRIYERLKI